MTADDATLIAAIGGVFIPLLVAFITKLNAGSGVKAFVNAGLTALLGLTATIVPGAWDWRVFITKWATAWVVSVGTYVGLLKPAGIAPAVSQSTQNVGIG